MAVADTCDGCRFDRPYLVSKRLAELSGHSIFIGHKEKLRVRPILLKKISFMIFFNNYLSDYVTLPLKRKNQQWFDRLTILSEVEGTISSFLSRSNLQFCRNHSS